MVRSSPRSHPPWLIRIVFGFVVASCLLVVGCAREHPPLRMGSTQWPGFETFFVARERGYWREDQVKLLEYTSTSELTRAFRSGAIDGGLLTLDEALRLAEDVPSIRILLITDISQGADVILANSAFHSMADLKGHRIGAETTGLGAYVLFRALEISHLTPDDVEIVPLDVAEQESAFESGSVDAVVTYEPLRTKLKNFGARQIFDSSQIPGEIVDVLVIQNGYLESSADNVRLLYEAFVRTQLYAREHPDDFVRIASAREGVTPDEFRQSMKLLHVPSPLEGAALLAGKPCSLLKQTRALADVMIQKRLLRKPVDIDSMFGSDELQRIRR